MLAFPLLKKLIFGILSLAVTSANVERTFSAINLNKTKIRNSVSQSTLAGILRTKEYVRKKSTNCHSFEPEMIYLKNLTKICIYKISHL